MMRSMVEYAVVVCSVPKTRWPVSAVSIAIVGKYVEHQDAYKSITESFIMAGAANGVHPGLGWIVVPLSRAQVEDFQTSLEFSLNDLPPVRPRNDVAGRVAVAEFAPNAALQALLREIMDGIHERCLEYGESGDGYIDYVKGANIAGFKKVADAMLAFGVV